MNGHNPQTPGPHSTGQQQAGSKRATPWIAGISAATAVIVLVAGIIWITTRGGDENKPNQPSPEASSSTTESNEASDSTGPSESDSQPSATDSASESPSGSEESESDDSSDSAEDPGTGINVLEGKLPKAGDPAPSNAIDANRTREDKGSLVASIQVPSGNIGCNIYKPAADNDRMGTRSCAPSTRGKLTHRSCSPRTWSTTHQKTTRWLPSTKSTAHRTTAPAW